MKRIIYFISIVLVSALYSCSGQYDNIEQYATDETIYVGKFSDNPYISVGYKRLEIELFGDSVGRALADDLYLGKAKKTIVEYEEEDGLRRIERDSVCSWVNITGLTTPKTYIFTIYAEDEHGNRSISVEALGKPFTDADMEGIAFPMPRVIPSPTTVEFAWENEVSEGLSSPLFKFVELIYSYDDVDGNIISGKLTAKDVQDAKTARVEPGFNIRNVKFADSTTVIINCRIIPIAESGAIIDTLSMIKEIVTKTTTEEEYLAARTLRPITSALINPDNESNATIIFGNVTDHLLWTKIRYVRSDGTLDSIEVSNTQLSVLCPNFKRGEIVQIRCAYNPPETDIVLVSGWTDYAPFILKRDPKRENWVVIPRNEWEDWKGDGDGDGIDDGAGTQNLWPGGHPMLVIDDNPTSGWHSHVDPAPLFPQALVIDMREPRRVSKVVGSNGSYLRDVQLYLTDELSIGTYYPYSHTINWDKPDVESYNAWVSYYIRLIPEIPPASWGNAMQVSATGAGAFSFTLPQILEKRFLILRFPNNTIWRPDWQGTYIALKNLEVYSD
jgi:hypothetical protein